MLDNDLISMFREFADVFKEYNSKLNLISKNDEKYIYEKHILDSISISRFFKEYDFLPDNILDIGTGGGFPAIPIAIMYPDINVIGIDSILKKINAVSEISYRLGLKNISFIRERVENYHEQKFDCVVSRAVAKIDKLVEYAYPLLNDNGYLVLYKSKTVDEEINNAKNLIRKYSMKIKPVIKYDLELAENYERCLVILQK